MAADAGAAPHAARSCRRGRRRSSSLGHAAAAVPASQPTGCPTGAGRGHRRRPPSPSPVPPRPARAVRARAVLRPAARPRRRGHPPRRALARRPWTPLLAAPACGRVRPAAVSTSATGQAALRPRADRPRTPASVTKLATAVAALAALGPDHRFTTTRRREADPSAAGPGRRRRRHPDHAPAAAHRRHCRGGPRGATSADQVVAAVGRRTATDAAPPRCRRLAVHRPRGLARLAGVLRRLRDRVAGQRAGGRRGPGDGPRLGRPRARPGRWRAGRALPALLARRAASRRGAPSGRPGDGAGRRAGAGHGRSRRRWPRSSSWMLTDQRQRHRRGAGPAGRARAGGQPATFAGGGAAAIARARRSSACRRRHGLRTAAGWTAADRLAAGHAGRPARAGRRPARPELARRSSPACPVAGFTGTLAPRFTTATAAGAGRRAGQDRHPDRRQHARRHRRRPPTAGCWSSRS